MTEERITEIWSEHDADGLAIPCLGERLPEELDRSTVIDPPPLPFGLLPEDIRSAVYMWLVSNVRTTDGLPAVYITSSRLAELLADATGITLTEIQMREAMLLLGMEPIKEQDDCWGYRMHRDCPCVAGRKL